jgi:hypothetical protein
VSEPALPPFAPLREVVARLEGAGLVCALGGSGLLAALGLTETVRDWDLTTDAAIAEVLGALGTLAHEYHGSSGIHADQKLVIGPVEVIVRFAFLTEGKVVRVPTVVTGRWRDVPLGSPEAWAVAYALMGRDAKAETLFAHLARGADPKALATLMAEPLPASLRDRLAALAARR